MALSFLAAALLSACSGGGASPTASLSPSPSATVPARPLTQAHLPMTVAVTVPLFADFVREIGRENVQVFALLPPDADPHNYRLTDADIARIKEADFFFVNGLGLDSPAGDLIEANRKEDAKVIPFAPNVRSPRGQELGDPDITAEKAGDNPHLWLDPMLARTYADIIADTFIIYDGIHEGFYKANLSAYSDRISQLDKDIRDQVQGIPEGKRKLVTYHDSFALFARRYGLEVAGFTVADPRDQPNPDDIARLGQIVRDQGVAAVFAEHGFDAAVPKQLADRGGVQLCSLYSDILGDAVQTYIDMMRSNLGELARCLAGATQSS